MKYFICFILLFILIPARCQDLYNPALIKQLKVKTRTSIFTGSLNDTLITEYDKSGRITATQGKMYGSKYFDSISYTSKTVVKRHYNSAKLLASIETSKLDKQGRTIEFVRVQFLPNKDSSGYKSVYKKGGIIQHQYFRDGKTLNIPDYPNNFISGINYYEDDTTYSYHLNNGEFTECYDEKNRIIASAAFDDKGNIIWSENYINSKPNEVTIVIRRYNTEEKSYSETIDTQYYFENGLERKYINKSENYTKEINYVYYP